MSNFGSFEFNPIKAVLANSLTTVPGAKLITLRGVNQAITTTAETVWSNSTAYAQLLAPVAFEIVSASANDAAAGTGARTVTLDLVDGSYVQTTVTVTLNGTTPVAITGTFIACNRAEVATTGSGLVNAGVIQIRTVSGSVVKRRIQTANGLGLGIDGDFIYTVPAGYVGVLMPVRCSGFTITGDLRFFVNIYDSLGNTKTIGQTTSSLYVTGFNGAANCKIDFGYGHYIPTQTLIELRVNASAGVGDVCGMGQLLLVRTGLAATPGV